MYTLFTNVYGTVIHLRLHFFCIFHENARIFLRISKKQVFWDRASSK